MNGWKAWDKTRRQRNLSRVSMSRRQLPQMRIQAPRRSSPQRSSVEGRRCTRTFTDIHASCALVATKRSPSTCTQEPPVFFSTRARPGLVLVLPTLFLKTRYASTNPRAAAHRHQVAAAAQPALRLLRPGCQGRHWHPIIILSARIERRVKSGARRPRLHHRPPDGVVHI